MSKKRVRKSSIKQQLRRRVGDVKRLEVVLVADSERDQYVAKWMDDNLGRGEGSEFTRMALEEKIGRWVGGSESVERLIADFVAQTQADGLEIDDLKARIAELEARIDTLEQENKYLWRELNTTNERLEKLRQTGEVEDDEVTTPISQNEVREAALSAKLKKMSFSQLTH